MASVSSRTSPTPRVSSALIFFGGGAFRWRPLSAGDPIGCVGTAVLSFDRFSEARFFSLPLRWPVSLAGVGGPTSFPPWPFPPLQADVIPFFAVLLPRPDHPPRAGSPEFASSWTRFFFSDVPSPFFFFPLRDAPFFFLVLGRLLRHDNRFFSFAVPPGEYWARFHFSSDRASCADFFFLEVFPPPPRASLFPGAR